MKKTKGKFLTRVSFLNHLHERRGSGRPKIVVYPFMALLASFVDLVIYFYHLLFHWSSNKDWLESVTPFLGSRFYLLKIS